MINGRRWRSKTRDRMRQGLFWFVLLLLGFWNVEPASAYRGNSMRPGSAYFSGESSLYYQEATGAMGSLAIITLKYIIVPILDDDEEDDGFYDPCCEPGCDGPDVPVHAYQFGGSFGFFVAPKVALGWRMIIQHNDEEDPIRSFWGGGPELSCYGDVSRYGARPFMSMGALYSRGRLRGPVEDSIVTGPSFLFRSGFDMGGPEGGLFVQTSYQTTPVNRVRNLPHTDSRWGIGMGFTVYID